MENELLVWPSLKCGERGIGLVKVRQFDATSRGLYFPTGHTWTLFVMHRCVSREYTAKFRPDRRMKVGWNKGFTRLDNLPECTALGAEQPQTQRRKTCQR